MDYIIRDEEEWKILYLRTRHPHSPPYDYPILITPYWYDDPNGPADWKYDRFIFVEEIIHNGEIRYVIPMNDYNTLT